MKTLSQAAPVRVCVCESLYVCVCVTTSAGEACDTQQAAQKQREFEWKAQQDRKAQAKQLTHIFALFWLCKRRRRKGA